MVRSQLWSFSFSTDNGTALLFEIFACNGINIMKVENQAPITKIALDMV